MVIVLTLLIFSIARLGVNCVGNPLIPTLFNALITLFLTHLPRICARASLLYVLVCSRHRNLKWPQKMKTKKKGHEAVKLIVLPTGF